MQHKVAKVRSFDHSSKVSLLVAGWAGHRGGPRAGVGAAKRGPMSPLLLTHVSLASWKFLVQILLLASQRSDFPSKMLTGVLLLPTSWEASPLPSPYPTPEVGITFWGSCCWGSAQGFHFISAPSPPQHPTNRLHIFLTQDSEQDHEPPYEISVQEEITARLHFVKFENTYIEACLDFIKDHLVNTETKVIQATGGGAYKFKDLIEQKLQLK